jgi:hypothetical protein
VLFPANSCHCWPNVIGLLSWLVDVVTCVKHEKFTDIMFNQEGDEEVLESFLDSKVLVIARFEVLSPVLLKTEILWDVTLLLCECSCFKQTVQTMTNCPKFNSSLLLMSNFCGSNACALSISVHFINSLYP